MPRNFPRSQRNDNGAVSRLDDPLLCNSRFEPQGPPRTSPCRLDVHITLQGELRDNQLELRDLRPILGTVVVAGYPGRGEPKDKKCPARGGGDRAMTPLPFSTSCRLLKVSWERDNLSTLFRGNPLHFLLESRRNVELNHLCHNHPPIQPHPSCCSITAKGVLLSCLFRCGLTGKASGSATARKAQLSGRNGVAGLGDFGYRGSAEWQ